MSDTTTIDPARISARVVLAERDSDTLHSLCTGLASCGHNVIAAVGDSAEAAEKAATSLADVVLLDTEPCCNSALAAVGAVAERSPTTAVLLLASDEIVTLPMNNPSLIHASAVLPRTISIPALDVTIRLSIARTRELDAARRDAANARRELEQRKIIERAKGVLMRRTGSTEQEAYRIMQRSSQDRSKPMVEIAQAVLASEPGLTRH